MDIHARTFTTTTTTTTAHSFLSTTQKSSSSQYSSLSPLRPLCLSRNSLEPKQNVDETNGDKLSTDWDKAWTNFRKQGEKTLFPDFSPNRYVSWNPRPSNYTLSIEVDPTKRTERSNLMLWTSPRFTLWEPLQ